MSAPATPTPTADLQEFLIDLNGDPLHTSQRDVDLAASPLSA